MSYQIGSDSVFCIPDGCNEEVLELAWQKKMSANGRCYHLLLAFSNSDTGGSTSFMERAQEECRDKFEFTVIQAGSAPAEQAGLGAPQVRRCLTNHAWVNLLSSIDMVVVVGSAGSAAASVSEARVLGIPVIATPVAAHSLGLDENASEFWIREAGPALWRTISEICRRRAGGSHLKVSSPQRARF
ncbi:hypothetical protein [Methylobacterium durans]|uniref:hypothetical protein n=1 Tax=Methylobacterium durans TaxID=2202825 RepID=UPI0013A5AE01|nr:hypothetical protein [Methylobacterium durans]